MDEVHYLISDASRKVDVEAHVLRYWEEELELDIPRNEMGHRYYTDFHIRMFRQVKSLKEKGYQLKAIKHALNQVLHQDGENGAQLTDELLEKDMDAALRGFKEEERLAEMELLLQSSDRKEEERFRQLDEVIRSFQKSGQAEAAAARVPFFKRKPFKRSGKSRNASGHPQRSGGLIP